MINMPPMPIEEAKRRANDAKDKMAKIAIKLKIMGYDENVLDADVLKKLQTQFRT